MRSSEKLSTAFLPVVPPLPEPGLRVLPLAWIVAGGLLLALALALLLWPIEAPAAVPLLPAAVKPIVLHDPEAVRRCRGTIDSFAEDYRGFRLSTGPGPIDVRFESALAADVAVGELVEVEGRLQGLDGPPPWRMKARLLKVLERRR